VARWQDLEDSAPDFAARARRYLDARVHKTIATLRADGSPRISGIESYFQDGDLCFGSMQNGRKALDLRRDPRFSLHSGSIDPPEWEGDAKISGLAEEIADPERTSHLFRADIRDVVLVSLNDARNRLVIELWRPDAEIRRFERD
jgi:nitroimidazol reductase NimA-like FMN-containing flavoprotein (pyridoxamine 5'-phosphate oxidase superfamily)